MQFGIDLGTTNSLISVFKDGQPQLIGKNDPLIPSVVGYLDGAVLVGRAAKERQVVHPRETAAAFKRAMGTGKTFKLGPQTYSAVDLSALVLSSLKDQARAEMGVEVRDVVISVPAYFNHLQRQAVRAAALAADLNPLRLINEPTAAAIAYGLQDIDEQGHILVFDLGGGTFDVSIVEVFEGVIEVKATSGDAFLGGEDFTAALYKHLAKENDIDITAPGRAALLWNAAETLKLRLSAAHEAQCTYSWQGQETTLITTRDQFAEIVAPLVLRLRLPVERALYDAGLARGEIEKVVLVGGATRMPLIRSQVTRMTGRLPEAGLNPDHVVALGACVQAGLTAKDSALDDIVMTDVTAFSLGFSVGRMFGNRIESGYFDPVIERNTTVPVSREQIFSTMEVGQTELDLELYQGEAPRVRDNIKLGALKLKIPRNRKEQETVSVRLSYDTSGLIEIDTTVLSTGATRSIVITDLTGALSKKEIEARRKVLSTLKTHPKDAQANIALVARIERCFAMAIEADRLHIQEMLVAFQQALDRQIPSEVEALFGTIVEQLDMFEAGYVR